MSKVLGLLSATGVPEIDSMLRQKSASKCLEILKRHSAAAIALDFEYAREVSRGDKLAIEGEAVAAAMAHDRARRIHLERCRRIQQCCAISRLLCLEASGDLRIDETTAGTGMSDVDRQECADVMGVYR